MSYKVKTGGSNYVSDGLLYLNFLYVSNLLIESPCASLRTFLLGNLGEYGLVCSWEASSSEEISAKELNQSCRISHKV